MNAPSPEDGESAATTLGAGLDPAAVHADATAVLELHRLCEFELDLTCGHCVTVSLNGWYPVSVACCDRLGGSWSDNTYHPVASGVEYARCLSERYEHRPPGSPREPTVLLARRSRTDEEVSAVDPSRSASTGRFPERVGAAGPPHTEGVNIARHPGDDEDDNDDEGAAAQ